MSFDKEAVLDFLRDILETDSPSGFTQKAMGKIERYVQELGYEFEVSRKGTGIVTLKGVDTSKTVGLCAHLDTLGLMVRSIKSNGTLAVTRIGGPIIPTLDGEYCKVYTRAGAVYTGTILSDSPSAHVHKDAGDRERTLETMHIRLDERVENKSDVLALGIGAGDFVCIDTKTVITDNDFIKSRFLDDKLSLAALYGVIKHMREEGLTPRHNVKILISSYEEVGHGMAYLPTEISELIAVDMGCIGDDLNCTEYDVSICVKDASGPYDYMLTNRLIQLAEESGLSYACDVYPFYSSDVSAALRAGHDISGALIGPGVSASHGMERSHYLAVENTMKLLAAYLV